MSLRSTAGRPASPAAAAWRVLAPLIGLLLCALTLRPAWAVDDNLIQLGRTSVTVVEGTPALSLVLLRHGSFAQPASVQWATVDGSAQAGSDFGIAGQPTFGGTVEWAAGDGAPKTITIPILDDTLPEGVETFEVALTQLSGVGASFGANRRTQVALHDNEPSVSFAQPSLVMSEAGLAVQVAVLRSGPPNGVVTVTWTTVGGTAVAGQDYGTPGQAVERSGRLTWAAGDSTPKLIAIGPGMPVPLINDTEIEGPETFAIELSGATGGAAVGTVRSLAVTIVDNDSLISFANTSLALAETGANGTLTVTRTGSTANAVRVNWSTVNGSALSGEDFGVAGVGAARGGVLSWAAGDDSPRTITVGPQPGATIPILNDSAVEATENFRVILTAPVGGAVLGEASALITIDSDDSGLVLSSAAQTVDESAGSVSFEVRRVGSVANAASVGFATVPGTALAGTHYTVSSGTLQWAAGDGEPKSFSIPIIDNDAIGNPRNFGVRLAGAVGARVGKPDAATVTITDSDNLLQFAAATATGTEGTPTLALRVLRTGSLAGPASVQWRAVDGTATAGQDYGTAGSAVPPSGLLQWAAGDGSVRTISIPILDDALPEGAESFTVLLENATGAGAHVGVPASVAVTLNDNESVLTVLTPEVSAIESGTLATVRVGRSGPLNQAVRVNWTTVDGTARAGQDFGTAGSAAPRSGTLAWAANDGTPKTVTIGLGGMVPLINDTEVEGPESFVIRFSDPSAGAAIAGDGTAVVHVVDDDSVLEFAATTLTVGETGANGSLTVTRTGSTATAASVMWTTANGSALAGQDFGSIGSTAQRSGVLRWAAGESGSRTVSIGPAAGALVPVINDTVVEAPETFTVTLSTPAGATLGAARAATVTILSEEAGIQVRDRALTVLESAGSAVVVVQRVGDTSRAASVHYTTGTGTARPGIDYTAVSGNLTWDAGDASPREIVVPVLDDELIGPPAVTVPVVLSAAVGATLTGSTTTVTLADDDSSLQLASAVAVVSESAPTVTLTVTRTGAAALPASVAWCAADGTATAGLDYGAVGQPAPCGTLNWAAGDAAAKTIVIPLRDDTLVEGAETFVVTLATPGGTGARLGPVRSTTVTVQDDDSRIDIAPVELRVGETGPNGTLSITRTGAAGTPVSVTWRTVSGSARVGSDYGARAATNELQGTLNWPAGDGSTKTITVGPVAGAQVPVIRDGVVEADETFTIVLSPPTGRAVLGAGTATVRISEGASAPQILVQPAPAAVVVPQSATFSVGVLASPAPSYRWQLSTDDGATFADIPGATLPNLVLASTTLADRGRQYRVVVGNTLGTVTSDAVTLQTMAVDLIAEAQARVPVPWVPLPPVAIPELDPPADGQAASIGLVFEESNTIRGHKYFDDHVWAFEARPRGNVFRHPLQLVNGNTQPPATVPFDLAQYDIGSPVIQPPLGEIPLAGRYTAGVQFVHLVPGSGSSFPIVLSAGGDGYFRLSGEPTRTFGSSLRVATRDVGFTEEFPRTVKMVTARASDAQAHVDFLVDSAGFTGAVLCRLQPGVASMMDCEATFFVRLDLPRGAQQRVGLIGVSSMFFRGAADTPGDDSDQAHDADHLVAGFDDGSQAEQALANPAVALDQDFVPPADHALASFALEQRERDPARYAAFASAGYATRSSIAVENLKATVTPAGVQPAQPLPLKLNLYVFPTNAEFFDNVVAHAVADRDLQAGDRVRLRYRLRAY